MISTLKEFSIQQRDDSEDSRGSRKQQALQSQQVVGTRATSSAVGISHKTPGEAGV